MPFPTAPRVIYEVNPLAEVICQLRFPPILRIDNELPAIFQDSIRNEYPNFIETAGLQRKTDQMVNPNDPNNFFDHIIKQNIIKEYMFTSKDESWKVSLSRTFIALSTSDYKKWESFRSKLEFIFNKFNEIYSPSYFSRIGLRYIDIIDRSKLNLGGINWNDLLQDYILGIISTKEGAKAKAFECKYEIELADAQSVVTIKTSFVKLRESGNQENCYMIDSDFFNLNLTPPLDVFNKLDFFHERATRLIRWAIKPRLHDAMKPTEIK